MLQTAVLQYEAFYGYMLVQFKLQHSSVNTNKHFQCFKQTFVFTKVLTVKHLNKSRLLRT